MKFKFKYVSMLVIAALMAGVTSCSDKDPVAPGTEVPGEDLSQPREDELTIQIEVPEAKTTRAESETNVGIAPYTFDMYLIFVGKLTAGTPQKVLRVIKGDVPALTGIGQKFKSMPLGVEGIYVIGNTDPAGYDMAKVNADPRGGATANNFGVLSYRGAYTDLLSYDDPDGIKDVTTEQFMKDVKISLDNYNLTDAKAVNISGYAPVTATQGTTPIRLIVTPAISRYEIREIKSKIPNGATEAPKFSLNGIYISNTMREISVDGQQYPNPIANPELVLNYGWNNPEWNYSLWNWPYTMHADQATNPGRLEDLMKDNLTYILKDPTNYNDGNYYKYSAFARSTAAYVDHHNYDQKGTWTGAATTGTNDIWKKWRETDFSKITTTGKSSYTPSTVNAAGNTVNGLQYWSFYIASARKQDKPIQDNPYEDGGFYNRIGLNCGTWPYSDEHAYVESGKGLKQPSPLDNSYNMAQATYINTMPLPTWAQAGVGIQYNAFPAICVHVTLDTPNTSGLKEGWLTITKFLDASTKMPLYYPKPGTVYIIKAIAFDADTDVDPDPMWPEEETDISVEVEVRGWVGQDTEVEF